MEQRHHRHYGLEDFYQENSNPFEAMMRLVTVLNRCSKFKRFVFASAHFDEQDRIVVSIEPRKNSKPECSECGCAGPTYDTAARPRLFEFIGIWGFPVFFLYRMRRVSASDAPG